MSIINVESVMKVEETHKRERVSMRTELQNVDLDSFSSIKENECNGVSSDISQYIYTSVGITRDGLMLAASIN